MSLSTLLRRSWQPLLALVGIVGCSFSTQAQAPSLLDDFNRPDGPVVGAGWVETETTPGTGASVANGQLRLSSGVLGKDFVTYDAAARYAPVLQTNLGQLTWAFNMQQSRPNPSGFANNNYGVAFVLAGSAANLLTGSGYAVVFGNAGTTDSLRLVKYTGGLTGPNALVSLVSVPMPAPVGATTGPFFTLRVTYSPDESTWTLERTANTTSFDDPATSVFSRVGARNDSTYTRTALPYLGAFWNHATTAAEAAVFDNIYTTAPCVLATEPIQAATAPTSANLTSSGAQLGWTNGSGTGRLVVVRPSALSTPFPVPVDGTTYPVNSSYGQGAALGGGYVVYVGSGATVSVTNLLPSTDYTFWVYEANSTGCAVNYRQTSPAMGSFRTLPCQVATAPTNSSQNVAATVNGPTATITWQAQAGSGTGHLVVVRAGQAIVGIPQNGGAYTASQSFGGGTQASPGEFIVYTGTGTSATITNLLPGQTYHVAVFDYNGTGCSAAYFTSSPARTSFLVPVPPTGSYRHYYGNLHAHSGYSDGNQDAGVSGASTPLQDYAYADASLHMDFLGISEHNHAQAGMSRPNYALGLAQADQATTADFVALYGMEWGVITGGGHVLVYGVNQLLGWEAGNYDIFVPRSDYRALFREVNRHPGAFATLAHPQSGDYNGLASSPFRPEADSAVVGTVLRSGPATSTNTSYTNPSSTSYESTYATLLARGYHVGISLDHDNHNTTFGRTTAGRVVVLAPSLSKNDLLAALRQRRFYASDDWNADVTFTLANQPMGSIFTAPASPSMVVSIADADAEGLLSFSLLRGVPGSGTLATVVATAPAGATALSYTDMGLATGNSAYYYAIIQQADGDRIVTSPIWYTRGIGTG
jgi:hypothetical protein